MKVLRSTNTSQRYRRNVDSQVLQDGDSFVGQANVSQYSASGAELQDIITSKHWADKAKEYAEDAKESADRAEDYVTAAKDAAEDSQGYKDLSLKYAELAQESMHNAIQSAIDAADSATNAAQSEDIALGHVADAKEWADKAKASEIAAAGSADSAEDSKEVALQAKADALESAKKAEEWAISDTTNNSAKHWAEVALQAASKSIVSEGVFTPTAEKEYPTPPTGIPDTTDIVWAIDFPTRDNEGYEFTTGPLKGLRALSQDTLFYDSGKSEWTLIESPVGNAIISVNGKMGKRITLNALEVGALPNKGLSELDGNLKVTSDANNIELISDTGKSSIVGRDNSSGAAVKQWSLGINGADDSLILKHILHNRSIDITDTGFFVEENENTYPLYHKGYIPGDSDVFVASTPDRSPTDNDCNMVALGYHFYELRGMKLNAPEGAGSGVLLSYIRDGVSEPVNGSQVFMSEESSWSRYVSNKVWTEWKEHMTGNNTITTDRIEGSIDFGVY